MATYKDNTNFTDSIINRSGLLDEAIDWIVCNMRPEEVYDEDQLEEWAKDNGYEKPNKKDQL